MNARLIPLNSLLLLAMTGFVIGGVECARAQAVVVEFIVKELWEAAAGDFTTIQFNEVPSGSFLADQYIPEGVRFTDGNDLVISNSRFFPNDGRGVRGGRLGFDVDIDLEFLEPQFTVASDYPGAIQFELYNQGELFYVSSQFGGVGGPFFAGLISTQPFDAVRILDWTASEVAMDDLHFGVPSPGALPLIVVGFLIWPPRRRHHYDG